MIGLASRGVLQRIATGSEEPDIILVGDPPTIVNATVLKPTITDASEGPQDEEED